LCATLGEDFPDAHMRQLELMRGPAGLVRAAGGPLSTANLIRAYTANHREWMAADAVRMRLRHEVGAAFEKFDVIMAPIAPVAAFKHDKRSINARKLSFSDGSTVAYMSMLCWIALATACRLPATAIPAGRTAAGLPVGVQLIGPQAGDARTLAVAQAIDENVRGFEAPPEL
jgi:amidase